MARHRGATRKQPQPANPRLRRGIVAVAVLGVAIGAMKFTTDWLVDPASFPVRAVGVEGELRHVRGDELRGVISPQVGNGLVQLSLPALQTTLEALPWVKSASVRRAWPDRLEVSIEEQIALARWGDGGLLNPDGERFMAEAGGELANLPLLKGPEQSERKLTEHLQEMQRMLEPLGLHIARLDLSERRAWSMTLDNGLELDLGRKETYPRLLRFVRVYPGVLASKAGAIQRIDLRYTNGFAVRWRDGAEAANA